MAYHLEGKDIVINGFEKGIADSPYSGVSDMRNIEIVSMPGEASVEPKLTAAGQPPAVTALAYTAAASTDLLTVASTSGYYGGMAIVLAANTATGLSNGVVYYVQNIVGNTFSLSAAPALTTPINITVNGTGTLSTIQYGYVNAPYAYCIDRTGGLSGNNATYVTDSNNYVWAILTRSQGALPADTLIFMGNYGVTHVLTETGITIWNGYLLLFTYQGIDYANTSTLFNTSVTTAWVYGWQVTTNQANNGRIAVLNSKEDGNIYWTTTAGLGSLIQQPGSTFNPATPATYAITSSALLLPASDESTCMAELGGVLLIGGRNSFVYIWNKVDPGFSNLLNVPENFISAIVATSQNAYVFSGVRGRIYITNGSGIDLYKKFPDYLTGFLNPVISWQDANFGRNQLYFSLTAVDMDGNSIDSLAGIWAIDIDGDALRMLNKRSGAGYTGTVRMVSERPPNDSSAPAFALYGNGVQLGWGTSNAGGVDVATSSAGYSSYESYFQTELMPVGTFLDAFSPSQIEWKTSAPLVSGEGVRISYRQTVNDNFTVVGESLGTTLPTGSISDLFQANFQKVQWAQFLVETKTTASNPSYVRVTELRVRDWPSGVNNKPPATGPTQSYGRK